MALTIHELERLQAAHPDYRMELVDGEVTIMSPSSYESDEVSIELARVLGNWVRPRQIGRVTGSSAGFILPNADTRAPDVSFVKAERLRRSPRSFAELAPDLMVEVKSPTDKLTKLRSKIQDFLALGTQVGILVDPQTRCVEVYRAGGEAILLRDGDRLTVPDLLPGWEVAVADLWLLVFE
ncbi:MULTISPECIES: Uma2 family endonuclease [Cyanophyceae]|uniref:Uma2 family endonuclease n=1 Tax=Cyanophyceae TaxID=3028117 RepID=UPI001689B8A7|nr:MULTISPECIES: Uma2 family endonuclease [Cyanophyceae]MBD1919133.1 Uma2 family endonuclease [Phormidium sp. FACHB-77]MBD2033134.1 Uma2 family endonuclease [Phormidium sp. FACHB-322]MBD2054062.1 Uma2 family endonuclease [Leptolyngbya sp. FACHB-60]